MMQSQKARILKEARALFWPWSAVILAGGLGPLLPFPRQLLRLGVDVSLVGFWVGFPLMAPLALGSEFQHRTLMLLLSQPVDRRKIWSEKWIVLLAAVLSSSLVYWFNWPRVSNNETGPGSIVCFSIVFVASAMFWTLVAKSTIGSLVLNALQVIVLLTGIQWMDSVWGPTASAIGGAVILAYALLMLWLGRQQFLRFQVTGELAGNDLFATNPRVLRSRPTGALGNLIRKELRLLSPVWLLALAVIVFQACLMPFRFVQSAANSATTTAMIVSYFGILLSALLCGSLSVGEERTLGTHAWQLTAPVSVRRQWFTKLAVVLFTNFICTTAILLAGQLLVGVSFIGRLQEAFGSKPVLPMPILLVWASSLVALAAFWCGCAVKGTIRAALWTFPAVAATSLAFSLTAPLTQFNRLLGFIVDRLHPFPFANTTEKYFYDKLQSAEAIALLAFLPVLVVLIQSYRLFRTEVSDRVFSTIRYLLLPLIATFVSGVLYMLPVGFLYSTTQQTWSVLRETSEAVERMRLNPATLDAANPPRFRVEDLAKSYPLSETSRRWLSNATITVTPRSIRHRVWDLQKRQFVEKEFAYFSTVQLKNDWSCAVYGAPHIVFSCTSPKGRWGYPSFP
jgi:hypothetical protein